MIVRRDCAALALGILVALALKPFQRWPVETGEELPARFMLKMVIAAADDDVVFSPDNLRASQKTGRFKTLLHHRCMRGAMPNTADVASEKHPSFAAKMTTGLWRILMISAWCHQISPQSAPRSAAPLSGSP
jgi:hypothetical protein